MKLSFVLIPAIAAVAFANPVAQKEPADPCDKCDKKFLACKNSWACWLNPPQCDYTCDCEAAKFEDCAKCGYKC